VHRPVGFGEDENFVDEVEEGSNVLGGLRETSIGIVRCLCVVVDWERLLLMGYLNFEVVAVDYICRHRGVVDVRVVSIGAVNIGAVDIGAVGVGAVDVGAVEDSVAEVGTVDVGVLIGSASRSGVFLGF